MNRFRLIAIIFVIQLLLCRIASAQEARNLDFSEQCASAATGLCSWDRSWGVPGSISVGTIAGEPPLHIRGEKDNSVGFAEQSIHLNKITSAEIVRVSATIHS